MFHYTFIYMHAYKRESHMVFSVRYHLTVINIIQFIIVAMEIINITIVTQNYYLWLV